MVKMIMAIVGVLVMLFLYYLALNMLDKQLDIGFARKENRFYFRVSLIIGSIMVLTWIAFCLLYESMELQRLLLMLIMFWALAVLTVTDLIKRKIPNSFLIVFFSIWMFVTGINMIFDIDSCIDLFVSSLIGGAIGGMIFFLCRLISGKRLGAGDVKLVFVLGLYLTEQKVLQMTLHSMVLCCIYILVQMARKKMDRKDSLPLVPFIFMGTIVTFLLPLPFLG